MTYATLCLPWAIGASRLWTTSCSARPFYTPTCASGWRGRRFALNRGLGDGGETWEVVLAHTGLDLATGERLRRVREYLAEDEQFMVTYGDGLADIDPGELIAFHGITVGPPPSRRAGPLAVRSC